MVIDCAADELTPTRVNTVSIRGSRGSAGRTVVKGAAVVLRDAVNEAEALCDRTSGSPREGVAWTAMGTEPVELLLCMPMVSLGAKLRNFVLQLFEVDRDNVTGVSSVLVTRLFITGTS